MYRVYKSSLLGDGMKEKFGTLESAMEFAKVLKKKTGGHYYIKDKSGNKVWNT